MSKARPRRRSSRIRTGCCTLRRTAPKGADDPGWERVSWDEALATIASRLTAIAEESGPEAVVFGSASPSTSAMSDTVEWLTRLRRAFGSPNFVSYMELCGWGRRLATLYTWGEPVPGSYLPDLDNAQCILYWGYNPSVSRLAHATATTAALRRGAKLVVVDPRRAGLASKADQWLRVRPGTDAALALSLTHVMIGNGWYDKEFVERWTNALKPVSESRRVWDLIVEECAQYPPETAQEITGVPADQIVATARLLWEQRPVAFYTWSGLEQHSNATQTVRAIGQLYALTGCVDTPGGNVLFTPVPANPIDGRELLSPEQRAKAIGVRERPLGPAKFEFVTGEDFYRAALEGALPGQGAGQFRRQSGTGPRRQRTRSGRSARAGFLRPHRFVPQPDRGAGGSRAARDQRVGGRGAADRFRNQPGRAVDCPIATAGGRRPREARSDLRIVFDLAVALGLGHQFFHGDIEAAWEHQLAPSGLTSTNCAPPRKESSCPCGRSIASMNGAASAPRPVWSSCTRNRCGTTDIRRCRPSPNRRSARCPGRIWRRGTR